MMTHKGTQTIETRRLILRRAVREDAEPMFRNWALDPEVTKYLTWPAHSSISVSEMVIKSWLQEYEKDSYYQWMMDLFKIDILHKKDVDLFFMHITKKLYILVQHFAI